MYLDYKEYIQSMAMRSLYVKIAHVNIETSKRSVTLNGLLWMISTPDRP